MTCKGICSGDINRFLEFDIATGGKFLCHTEVTKGKLEKGL